MTGTMTIGGRDAAWLDPSPNFAIGTCYNGAGDGGYGSFVGAEMHPPVAIFSRLDAGHGGIQSKADATSPMRCTPINTPARWRARAAMVEATTRRLAEMYPPSIPVPAQAMAGLIPS